MLTPIVHNRRYCILKWMQTYEFLLVHRLKSIEIMDEHIQHTHILYTDMDTTRAAYAVREIIQWKIGHCFFLWHGWYTDYVSLFFGHLLADGGWFCALIIVYFIQNPSKYQPWLNPCTNKAYVWMRLHCAIKWQCYYLICIQI